VDKNNGIFGAVTRRDMNLMATVSYFTTMNQPQQVGRTDKRWRPLCILYLLLCNDVVACWEHAASNDIDTAKLAGEEGNKSELWQFAVFHWSDSGKPRPTSVRTARFTGPTSNYRGADKSLA